MKMKSNLECLSKNNFKYYYMDKCTSTMEEAKKKINSINENFIIRSGEQINGIGRRGNKWISPYGNLYFSIVIKDDFEFNKHFLYNMMLCLIIKESLEHFNIKNIFFKWPNDILINSKKISGIILENYNLKENKYLIIGTGINFSSSPKLNNYDTTHIL